MEHAVIPVEWDRIGRVLGRPNRFLALVDIDGLIEPTEAHVHDPGRLKEILYPGNEVLLREASRTDRKTHWDVIAGRGSENWVLINSSFHRKISQAVLSNISTNPFGPLIKIRPEVKIGRSRLDYLVVDENGRELYIEVKGCSLTKDGIALFPDAPTERGTRHILELIDLKRSGKRAGLMILILGPGSRCFMPNSQLDPKFSRAFIKAVRCGVEVKPISFELRDKWIIQLGEIPLCDRSLSNHI